MSLNHAYKQLALCLRLIRFDDKVADEFANDKASARRSFAVLWFVVPYSVLLAWLNERPFIEAKDVSLPLYFGLRVAAYAVSVVLGLLAVYQLARWQGLAQNFPRWLVSYNWLAVLMCFLLLPVSLCIAFRLLPDEQLTTLGILTYLFTLYVVWLHSWRMLKCDIFVAAGAAILPVLIGGVVNDFTNLRLYGVARPFFDLP